MATSKRTSGGPAAGGAGAATGDPTKGRWGIVAAALLLQFSIGAVYAWSVFSKALQDEDAFGLSKVEASLPFTVTIGMIFIGAYIGGRWQDRAGPRPVALTGGVIYAVGILLASLVSSADELWLLILGYGVISGFGLGLAYIVPIAMLLKWFPDKRGLITGLAVGGFGFGAVLTAPVAEWLIGNTPETPTKAFLPLGIAYLVMSLVGAAMFRNPPQGYAVPGWSPSAATNTSRSSHEYTQNEALKTPQWYLLTAILTLNVAAGIWAIFNGGGRIVWAAASDKMGRMPAFAAMLGLQGLCFLALPHAGNAALFFVLGAIIYLCYGGGFGTMPATAGDFFGVKFAGAIYGLMLIGWSLGGVLGPQLAASLASGGAYTRAYTTIGIISLASVALTFITKVPRGDKAGAAYPAETAGSRTRATR
jgi:OFA family oxalate/formate antiporter-like MFS transporter